SRVTLKVYDILGREVADLVNDVKTPGNYKVNFNASNLASGVYFYR
ncbi:MAG: T9SS type A sorting domain-containing protein, partial [Ignavibacteriaceae bacterium]